MTTLSSLSHYYFGRPVEELTLIEVVRLVTALPGLEMSPYSHSEQFNIKAKTVLSRLLKVNLINEQDYNFSIQDFK